MASSVPEARMLVSCLPRIGFTTMSFSAGVLADDHAFIELVARGDEEAALRS